VSQLQKTLKHSAIYGIGELLRQLTGFVMLPIYTRYLTPSDYGVVELLTMTIAFVSIFIGLRISQAMFRFYILAEAEKDKQHTVSTVMVTIMVSGSLGSLVVYLAAAPVSMLLFGSTDYLYEVQLFSVVILFGAVIDVCLSYLRARQMPVLFVSIGVVTLVLQVSLNVLFVVFMDLHVKGVVYSVLISNSLIATGLAVYVLSQVGLSYSRSIASRIIKFIAPLMLASVAVFYVGSGDRFFLRFYGGLVEVGLYALAWRVSSIVMTTFETFQESWFADQFEVVKRKDASEIYNQIFHLLSAIMLLAGAGVALFANDFFHIMTAPAFYAASNSVPIIVTAILFQVLTMFCSFGILYKENTRHIAEANWIKAIIATVGYVLLIPRLGAMGAASAILLAYIVEFVWTYYKSKASYDMGLDWKPVNTMAFMAVVCVLGGLFLPEGDIDFFLVRVVMYCVLLYAFFKIPRWTREERKFMTDCAGRIPGLSKLK